MIKTPSSLYRGHRFPAEVIAHAVWLYFRFPLSLRMVEEFLLARGITVSHETVRRWAEKFGRDLPIRRSARSRGSATISGIWTKVCREGSCSDVGAELQGR